jgi:hypothetical protein
MKHRWLAVVALAALVTVIAGCSKPETPEQVAREFWQALAEGDAGQAVDFSTLTDPEAFDRFNLNDLKTLPDFGRIVIDADQATIVTRIPAPEGASGERRELVTHLVRIDDQWLVDYQDTRDAITERPALSGLMSDLDRFSKQLDESVGETSGKLSKRVDEMAEEFRTYSEETGQKAEDALERFGNSLRDLRKQIEESLDEAEKNRQQERENQEEPLDQASI